MTASGGQGPITEINVTPLVDVCLVLVIIFMVVAPFVMQAGIEVATSRVGAARGQATLRQNVSVELDAMGHLKVNGLPVGWEKLGQAVAQGIKASRDKLVALNASPKARVGQVVEILDVSRQNGAQRLALMNQ